MQRLAALTVTSLLALSACSGGGTAPSLKSASAPSASQTVLRAYRLPLVHSAALDASAALGEQQLAARGVRKPNDLGSTSTLDATFCLLDAPRFGAGAQVNVALLGVSAIGATDGITYTIASYASPVVVNMLAYHTSALVMGSAKLPAQSYTIQLQVKASASSLLSNGVSYPVSIGSYDANHNFTAASDVSTISFPATVDTATGAYLAHFNMLEMAKISNGVAYIGSHIKSVGYSSSAIVSGTVVNNAGLPVGQAVVAALDSTGATVSTTITADDGTFHIHAMSGATYQVVIKNNYTAASGDSIVANGADSASDLNGPAVTVPGGYEANIGNIVD